MSDEEIPFPDGEKDATKCLLAQAQLGRDPLGHEFISPAYFATAGDQYKP
jgi:hypothetical protein